MTHVEDWRGEHLIRSPRAGQRREEREAAIAAHDYRWFAARGYEKGETANLCGVRYSTVASWASSNPEVRWAGERRMS